MLWETADDSKRDRANYMKLRLPPLYKTLLMLALVFGPFFWLMFTQDGQRRTDLVVSMLFGKDPFDIAIDQLHGGLTEQDFRDKFPGLELQCREGANPFGDRLCAAAIGSFNQIPSRSVVLFFTGDFLRAVKIVYRASYHNLLLGWVSDRVRDVTGAPVVADQVESGGVGSWVVDGGTLFVKATDLEDGDEPALLWLSETAVQRH